MSGSGTPESAADGTPQIDLTNADDPGSRGEAGRPAPALPKALTPAALTFGQRAHRTWCTFVKAAGATFGIY